MKHITENKPLYYDPTQTKILICSENCLRLIGERLLEYQGVSKTDLCDYRFSRTDPEIIDAAERLMVMASITKYERSLAERSYAWGNPITFDIKLGDSIFKVRIIRFDNTIADYQICEENSVIKGFCTLSVGTGEYEEYEEYNEAEGNVDIFDNEIYEKRRVSIPNFTIQE